MLRWPNEAYIYSNEIQLETYTSTHWLLSLTENGIFLFKYHSKRINIAYYILCKIMKRDAVFPSPQY